MWIFLNDAFLSVVAHTQRPDDLLVRARVEGDIERTFPEAEVHETPHADYRYRAILPRDRVADAIGARLRTIEYPNFKASVPPDEWGRSDAYHGVWSRMVRLQERA